MRLSIQGQARLYWAALPLRRVIGFGFMAHCWAKFSRGPDKFADLLQWIGVPLPHVTA